MTLAPQIAVLFVLTTGVGWLMILGESASTRWTGGAAAVSVPAAGASAPSAAAAATRGLM